MKGASGFSNMDHTWFYYRFVLSHKVLLEQKKTLSVGQKKHLKPFFRLIGGFIGYESVSGFSLRAAEVPLKVKKRPL